jgi:hypothetical protein
MRDVQGPERARGPLQSSGNADADPSRFDARAYLRKHRQETAPEATLCIIRTLDESNEAYRNYGLAECGCSRNR